MNSTRYLPLIRLYWTMTLLLFAGTCAMVAFWTPEEATMGLIQKIFYLHVPAAIMTVIAALTTFGASIGYMVTRQSWLDDLGSAAARVVVQLCAVVLITGMIWGQSAWGTWWTWSPRLTFTLLMFLLYLVYLVLRMSVESSQRCAMICAVYGIIAFLDVPLVYLSVKLMPDIHPASIKLAPEMRITLIACSIPMFLLSVGLIWTRFSLNSRARALEQSRRDEAHDVVGPLQSVGDLS